MVSIRELIDNLRATKPPYECPLCQKIYKSYSGIEYHLQTFKHDGSEVTGVTYASSKSKKGKGRGRKSVKNKKPPPSPLPVTVVRETLTYAQAQEIVEVEIDGVPQRIHINDRLDLVEDFVVRAPEKCEVKSDPASTKPVAKTKSKSKSKTKNKNKKQENVEKFGLPLAEFWECDVKIKLPDAPARPTAYFRYIEQTAEDLDDMVEYDMDEEDYAWLYIINDQRKSEGVAPVSQEIFETLMDRLEKESYFESQSNCDPNQYIDEDAVCCICNDGECQNSNVILFCDMCNLAVHQECYGVPYIPEGQWLCRRCLQSPSRAVDCVLCPNRTGAFKQTDDAHWAHVVCALWIPEVCFANTVFLEPIDSIANIPSARWKLTCYICKRRQGACIQCFKTNCYTAFHVTCAQQAGLFMKIEPVKGENGQLTVRKATYCDVHTPTSIKPGTGDEQESTEDEKVSPSKTPKSGSSKKSIKKFRKLLAEKKTAGVPIVNIPFIPAHRLSKIVSRVAVARKSHFIHNLQSYWMLKRQSRNGVPLLRRLQATHQSQKGIGDESSERSERIKAMKEQLHFWQRLRHDLERARLLVELIRKREKLKREEVKVKQHVVDLQLQPLNIVLRRALDQLVTKDPGEIFAEPVDTDEVTDYLDIIDTPMDFSTMRKRIDSNFYRTVDQFEADFNLIVKDCLRYNAPDTIFYRAALKLRDQGRPIIRAVQRQVERAGIDPVTGLHTEEAPTLADREPTEEDFVLTDEQKRDMTLEEQLKDLLEKQDMTQAIKHGGVRATRARMLKKEIALVRRKINQEKRHFSESSVGTADGTYNRQQDPSPPMGIADESSDRARQSDEMESGRNSVDSHNKNSAISDRRLSVEGCTNKSVANPSPGTSRRSGILFNKGRHRVRRNLGAGSDKGWNESNLNHVIKPSEPERVPDVVSTEFQVTENCRTDEEEILFDEGVEQRHESAQNETLPKTDSRAQKRRRNESASSVESYVPKKTYRTELGKLIEDATLPMFETASDKLNSNHFALTNGLRQRNYRSYTSGSESDAGVETRVNGSGRWDRLPRKFSMQSEDELSTTDTESNACENKAMNGPVEEKKRRPGRPRKATSDSEGDYSPLAPLDLVWAKCRGYPSYPAMIINPQTKKGFVYKGVPIPVPPDEVLKERTDSDEHLYLVLFFDNRRTWQWLPRHKLECLGVDTNVDEAKIMEGRKTSMRKSVQQAYERAINHRNVIANVDLSFDERDEDDHILEENGFN